MLWVALHSPLSLLVPIALVKIVLRDKGLNNTEENNSIDGDVTEVDAAHVPETTNEFVG